MKKILLALMAICLSSALFAADSTFDMKAGTSWADGPQKWGLDITPSFNYGLDKFLALGIEPGFQWYRFDKKELTGKTDPVTNQPEQKVFNNSVYSIPLSLNARLRFDVISNLQVFLSGGVGYNWVWFQGSGRNDEYQGLLFQGSVGGAYRLGGGGGDWSTGSSSNIGIVGEVGYRLSEPTKVATTQIAVMSGVFLRVGIRYYMSGAVNSGSF